MNGMGSNLLQNFDCQVKKLELFSIKLTAKYHYHQLSVKKEMDQFFALAFNAKSFAIAILVFFVFFLHVQFSGRTVKSFLGNVLRSVRYGSFLGHA